MERNQKGLVWLVGVAVAIGVAASQLKPRVPTIPPPPGMVTTASGLKYKDIVVGTGPFPRAGQTVSAGFTGTLTNGWKFDSTYDRPGGPLSFVLGRGQVIKGWDEGLATMRKGGRRHLEIPPSLGYGNRAMGPDIPANSTLLFDVELVDIK